MWRASLAALSPSFSSFPPSSSIASFPAFRSSFSSFPLSGRLLPWKEQPCCLPTASGTRRDFSKYYGNARRKRLPLTTKRARKGYYKGNRCNTEGRHTSKGGYIMDRSRMLELVVPDLAGFKLKPYVSNATPRHKYPTAQALYEDMKGKR